MAPTSSKFDGFRDACLHPAERDWVLAFYLVGCEGRGDVESEEKEMGDVNKHCDIICVP